MASGNPQNTTQKPSGKKATPISQKEQSVQFIETARMIDADESGNSFEKAAEIILKNKN